MAAARYDRGVLFPARVRDKETFAAREEVISLASRRGAEVTSEDTDALNALVRQRSVLRLQTADGKAYAARVRTLSLRWCPSREEPLTWSAEVAVAWEGVPPAPPPRCGGFVIR